MTFTQSIKTCLRKYFTFSGRASRPEYWWFILFLFLGSVVANILDGIVFGYGQATLRPGGGSVSGGDGPLASLFSLGTIIPSLSAGWRRMHDTGRSGLFLMYPLIVMIGITMFFGLMGGLAPLLSGDLGAVFAGTTGLIAVLAVLVLFVSPLIVLWWLTRPSQPGSNKYGPNPNEVPQ